MKKVNEASLKNSLRERYLNSIVNYLQKNDEDVLRTGSGDVSIPCLDDEGNERYVQIKVIIPNGSRDGDAFDPYALAQEYQLKIDKKKKKDKEEK